MATKELYLAGGCFWGAEHFLRQIAGVKETCPGFANGNTPSPSYKEVYTDTTGYAETVKVVYDPLVLPIKLLVSLYFKSIDPLSLNRQGHDEGTRYRTGIYFTSPEERDPIMEVYALEEKKAGAPLAVEVEPLRNFYPAEEYHKDYLIKNPDGYCHLPLEMFSYARKANRTQLYLRKAVPDDLDAVSLIMTQAVDQMLREGKNQWDRTYPLPSDILADMEKGVGIVLCRKAGPFPDKTEPENEEILAYAAVVFDGEKAYDDIEGQWISDFPYVVVHRIAVSDSYKRMGTATKMMEMIGDYALEKGYRSFRIDTNYDNTYMQKMLSSLGFSYIGKCFYPRGERLCYEKILG